MDLEGVTLGEVNQTERNKYCMISLVCGIKNAKLMKQSRMEIVKVWRVREMRYQPKDTSFQL